MCGITGILTADGLQDDERAALRGMMACLAHRGPDGSGTHVSRLAALGHQRLAIIDLPGGGQPIANEDGTVHGLVNGEIYNFQTLRERLVERGHRFRTVGDSECAVHLYEEAGEACAEALGGMFALAVWDERRRMGLLARDRLGVKPLYYHVDGRRLVFGSELKAVLAAPGVPRALDPTALADFLTFGFISAPKTIFRDVRKLPAGSVLTYGGGRVVLRSYWDLQPSARTGATLEQTSDDVWRELCRATRERLVADVPIGALLSGGLDSTAVVAAMREQTRGAIVTVTCGFDEAGHDERASARAVASALGTRHFDLTVRADVERLTDELTWHFDEPFADPSALPMFELCRLAKTKMTVALSGDGGDEMLAGYRRYRFDHHEERVRRRLPGAVRRAIFAPLAAVYPRSPRIPRLFRAAATLRNLTTDGVTAHAYSIATTDPALAARLPAGDLRVALRGYDPLDHVRVWYARCSADHVTRCQYVDARFGLADGILTKVNRASMAHGLEVRSPMLDASFAGMALGIPTAMRFGGGAGKRPLRAALRRRMGEAVSSRPKAGFDVPLDDWFRGVLRRRFEEAVLTDDPANGDLLDVEVVDRLWREHQSRSRNHGPTLWKVLTLNLWARRFLQGPVARVERPSRSLACIPGS